MLVGPKGAAQQNPGQRPRLTEHVISSQALNGRNKSADLGARLRASRHAVSPFQGLHPKKRILAPRPSAWALLARPFGAWGWSALSLLEDRR
jgi:hypothetical protein